MIRNLVRILIPALLISTGFLSGYFVNEAFRVKEIDQINLVHQDVTDYIHEILAINKLLGDGYGLMGKIGEPNCYKNTLCIMDTISKGSLIDGEVKTRHATATRIEERIIWRQNNWKWLKDIQRIFISTPIPI